MSKITITVDTETKECSLNVDGKVVTDVDSISVYNYDYGDGDKMVEFYASMTPQKIGDVVSQTTLRAYANQNDTSSEEEEVADKVYVKKKKKNKAKAMFEKHWSYNT